jgi:tubulin--tyrosine ligase-like protein 12
MDFSSLYNYAVHFTVNNYRGENLIKMLQEEFVVEFDKNHGAGSWEKVYEKIKKGTKGIMGGFQGKNIEYERSRALYGIDLMITEDLEVQFLELTYAPDCIRAVDYYPEFFNHVFEVLFLGEEKESFVRL